MSSSGPAAEDRWRLVLVLLAIGASSLVWQVSSARWMMAALHGDELIMGLVLGSWLVLMGGSTATGARLAERRDPARRPFLLCIWLLLCPVGMLLSLAAQQQLLSWTGSTGQLVGPGRALGSSLACLLPACVPLGGAFGALVCLAPAGSSTRRWAAWIYLVESLGMVLAGIIFHLWLARVSAPGAALLAGLLPWLAALPWLLRRSGQMGPRRGLMLAGGAGLASLVLLTPLESMPGRSLLRADTPGYELLERRNSRHGALAVLRRGDQVLFQANGSTVFSNQDHRQVEAEVHLSLLAHPAPRRVLMIGGGLGGGLVEALKHRLARLDYVELDAQLMALASRWGCAPPRDPRLRLRSGDGRRLMTASPSTYDVILVSLPGPSSALNNRLYTEQALATARRALRTGGILRVSLAGSETYLGDELALVHATVRAGMRQVFGNVTALPGARTLLLAGRTRAPALVPAELVRRLRRRGLELQHLGPAEILTRALPFARDNYQRRLARVRPLHNTDLRPTAYFHSSLQWLTISAPALAHRLAQLARLVQRWPWLAPVAPLLLAALLMLVLRRRRPLAAALAIALAGFCGMVVELALLLACQTLRGVVYHELAALLSAFMAGLAGGAWLGKRIAGQGAPSPPATGGGAGPGPTGHRRGVHLALGGCALASGAAPGAMQLAILAPALSLPLLLATMTLMGLATGACFAPAAVAMRAAGAGPAAARSYAWDLTGAAAGALVASAFALPVLGLPLCCLVCVALCVGAMVAY